MLVGVVLGAIIFSLLVVVMSLFFLLYVWMDGARCVRAPRTYPIRIAGDLSPRQQTEHRIRNRTIVHSTRQGTTVILPTSCPTIE